MFLKSRVRTIDYLSSHIFQFFILLFWYVFKKCVFPSFFWHDMFKTTKLTDILVHFIHFFVTKTTEFKKKIKFLKFYVKSKSDKKFKQKRYLLFYYVNKLTFFPFNYT